MISRLYDTAQDVLLQAPMAVTAHDDQIETAVSGDRQHCRLDIRANGAHAHDAKYAILRRGGIELHFFELKALLPAESYAGCYVRVTDVESIFQQFSEAALPKTGIPRMEKLENKLWGLREFAVVDLNGNLLRIGQVMRLGT